MLRERAFLVAAANIPGLLSIGMALVHLRDEDSEGNYARDRTCFTEIRSVLQSGNIFSVLFLPLSADGVGFLSKRDYAIRVTFIDTIVSLKQ